MLIFVDLLTYYSFKNNSEKKFFLNQIHWYWKLNCFNISEDVIYREGFSKQFLNSDDSAAFSSFYISRFWTYLTQDLDRCGHLLLTDPLIFLFLCASLKMIHSEMIYSGYIPFLKNNMELACLSIIRGRY